MSRSDDSYGMKQILFVMDFQYVLHKLYQQLKCKNTRLNIIIIFKIRTFQLVFESLAEWEKFDYVVYLKKWYSLWIDENEL